jgi:hypothetical protein
MLFITLFEYISFSDRSDAIFRRVDVSSSVFIEASGSMGLRINGKCQTTHPNDTLSLNEEFDWCSNIAKTKDQVNNPWISYSLKGKTMRLTGYSLRNGCCRYLCCCVDDSDYLYDCCCELYSFELQGSNDNKTWSTIHRVEKVKDIRYCHSKSYEFPKTDAFVFIRLVQTEEYPGCPKCMQINQVELYGEVLNRGDSFIDSESDDESISIIGKIRRND